MAPHLLDFSPSYWDWTNDELIATEIKFIAKNLKTWNMESEFIYFTIIYSILKQKAEGKWGIREELEQKKRRALETKGESTRLSTHLCELL